MNNKINYERIAKFLLNEEEEAIKNGHTVTFDKVHQKLNRLFNAWRKSQKKG